MSTSQPELDKYSARWFQERAFGSLQKINDGAWDYSDSLLLYTSESEEQYETMQQGEDLYAKLVTEPERKFLLDIADRVMAELPNEFEYLDLGPGTAHKEQFIFDAAERQNKKFAYRPVDINKHYLKLAVDYAAAQQIRTSPLRASFEELPDRLGKAVLPRFVSLGLTFSNYPPQEILGLLKEIAGAQGTVFVDVQVRDRVDMNKIKDIYQHDIKALVDAKIRLLGLDPSRDVSNWRVDDGIRGWYTLERVNQQLKAMGLKKGDALLMFQSLRYTKEALEKELVATGLTHVLLDTGMSFVGALLKT